MGTVGPSFGAATSGQGFNVSATVAEIVGNLQNVETPWKTQLTTLESQDTTISSLGTLLSNLSNDTSSLTNMTGILAQKTGSSSDTNVLTLTAATSSAVAGTHTVEVTNLAQTSSGYLAPITNASDPLSGSVTLQAGSGTAHTFAITSADNTLSKLASTINSSGAGITASVLTDSSGSRLSLVSGTSGANGNLTISANSIAASDQILGYTGTAGTTGVASTGSLSPVGNSTNTLTGSISVAVGGGTADTIVAGSGTNTASTFYTGTSVNTLSTLETTIQNNSTSLGFTANVVGTTLSLTSGTTGTTGTLTVTSSIVDTNSSTLGYTSTVTGKDANLTVDGVNLTSGSNMVANLIPGITFQLLAPSATGEQVQVVIGNDNTDVESTVNQMVSDYNSLISAMNTQEGYDSSGNAEPLFGSPTLTLLQQQLLGSLNTVNPNGSLSSISTNTGTTLSGSVLIQAGSGTADTVVIGAGTNTANTFYTGTASGYNTLSGLASAIQAANSSTALSFTDAGTTGTTTADSGTLTANSTAALSGSIAIAVGSGTAENIVIGAEPSTGAAANTIYTGSGVNTLSGLAGIINANTSLGFTAAVVTTDGIATLTLTSGTVGSAGALTVTPGISAAGLGVTASVVTSGGQSTLALTSQTAGSNGALTVSSSISATSDTPLSYSDKNGYTSTTPDSGALTAIAAASDALTGSIKIQVGSGAAQTINVPAYSATSPSNNLSGLAGAINAANIGVTASLNAVAVGANAIGTILTLTSNSDGSTGALTVTSNILDTTKTSTATLGYTNSSDINSLTGLGISVNNDGSLTFDATSLDSVLNSDYSGVVGFFQNANGWGQSFSTMLNNAGTSSATGILSLASSSNSNIESTLNADITKEESYISAQQSSLTTELNQANQIMQELPTQLEGINELYSAVTGYNQNTGG